MIDFKKRIQYKKSCPGGKRFIAREHPANLVIKGIAGIFQPKNVVPQTIYM